MGTGRPRSRGLASCGAISGERKCRRDCVSRASRAISNVSLLRKLLLHWSLSLRRDSEAVGTPPIPPTLQRCSANYAKGFQGALFSRVPPSTSSSLRTWRSPSRVTSWNNRRNLQVLLSKSQCMDRRDCGCGNSTRLSSLSATIVDIKFRPKVSFRHYFPLLAVARAR